MPWPKGRPRAGVGRPTSVPAEAPTPGMLKIRAVAADLAADGEVSERLVAAVADVSQSYVHRVKVRLRAFGAGWWDWEDAPFGPKATPTPQQIRERAAKIRAERD